MLLSFLKRKINFRSIDNAKDIRTDNAKQVSTSIGKFTSTRFFFFFFIQYGVCPAPIN